MQVVTHISCLTLPAVGDKSQEVWQLVVGGGDGADEGDGEEPQRGPAACGGDHGEQDG